MRVVVVGDANLEEAIAEAAAVLRSGALVVVPTDTVYGIAADARAEGAEEKIRLAKSRPASKTTAFLAASLEQVEAAGAVLDEFSRNLALRFWPGALTLVLLTRAGVLRGYRVPDHKVALALAAAAGAPLLASSANKSGLPPALTAREACEIFKDAVELCLDAGPAPGRSASTVVRVEGRSLSILRHGAISAQELQSVAGCEIMAASFPA